MANSPSCLLCNNDATTREHIIPQWIQKSFSLSDLKLRLWNGTFVPYKQVVIPLCQTCNGNLLSRLESKVRLGTATEIEYYLWALKIRFCLSIKDSTLPMDRSNPSSGPLLSSADAFIGHDFVKHSLQNFERKGFIFSPNPFGSVFLFDNPIDDNEFGFADVANPYWGLSISLPNKKILCVLFTDRCLVKNEVTRLFKKSGGIKRFFKNTLGESTSQTVRLIMFKLIVWQYKFSNVPYGVSLKENGVISQRVPNRPNYRKKLKKEVIIDMGRVLGFPDSMSLGLYNSLPADYRG